MADVWQLKRAGDDEALEKALLDLVQMTEIARRKPLGYNPGG